MVGWLGWLGEELALQLGWDSTINIGFECCSTRPGRAADGHGYSSGRQSGTKPRGMTGQLMSPRSAGVTQKLTEPLRASNLYKLTGMDTARADERARGVLRLSYRRSHH